MWKKPICYLSCLLALAMARTTLGELVGHWTFNEGSGGQIADSSGRGNHGTIAAGNPAWVPGVFGSAMEFHGLGAAGGGGDYINCGSDASLNIPSQISIALWIKPGADDPEGKGTETAPMAKALSTASPSWSWQVRYGWGSTQPFMAFTFNTSPRAWAYLGRKLDRDEWCHIACSHDGATLRSYLDGEEVGSTAMGQITSSPAPVLIGSDGWGCDWIGAIDDVRIYNHGLTVEEIAGLVAGGGVGLAKEPSPEDMATDVLASTGLSWMAGEFAATHDVYLGTVFADVNDAGRGDPRSVLVSQGQANASYLPASPLEYGLTYYWRIDEVNAAPDFTIFKGQTWSFTVEPYGYPITNITATASSAQPGMVAQNTVNGSGLNDLDQHSIEALQMWTSGNTMPHWIQFEFDKVYKLHEMWVWNSNQMIESFVGFGAKDVTVEYSADGATWTALDGVPPFAQASGAPTYTANTAVDLGGVMAQYVKLTIASNWGGVTTQAGLSEVRFFYVPLQAFGPAPANDGTDVPIDAELTWRPGREATSHVVYFGTDSAAVADGTAPAQTVTDAAYTPPTLDVATVYYWKVNEAGDADTYEGDVWSFTSQEYVAIEDFEIYDDEDLRIFDVWIDGYTTQASGSTVGYLQAPFAERTNRHGGRQAMPLFYDNTASPFYSEAERTFDSPQNWSAHGADTLVVYFQGVAAGTTGNSAEGLYVTVKDNAGKSKTVAHPDAAATNLTGWQQWEIPLTHLTSAGVNATAVKSIVIGVGNRASPKAGGTGKVYIDDLGYGSSVP